MMKILVTGSAGFIGFHTARHYLEAGHHVLGFDGFTNYYDTALKQARDSILQTYSNFSPVKGMLQDKEMVHSLIEDHRPEIVIHLAAQAGVRYSIENPESYISSNVQGSFNLLEALRAQPPKHLLFASTSSVYGGNVELPFKEKSRTAYPVSLYAATKAAGESITHSYAGLFGIPTTCFRFFTVYGPWGRPDMALFKFVEKIKAGEPIDVYGQGAMYRDFTYINDLVKSLISLAKKIPETGVSLSVHDTISPTAPWRLVNIAGGQPRQLMDFIRTIENRLGMEAVYQFLPMQDGDVVGTEADISLLKDLIGAVPETRLEDGISEFVKWYEAYYCR